MSEIQSGAIFLDRDGTINLDRGYTHRVEDLIFLDGAVEALKLLHDADYKLIITTNQSGIGRGYFTREQFYAFNSAMVDSLAEHGVTITDTMMCPHSPSEECLCRKPLPYMVDEASRRHNIDRSRSFMLGDKRSDVECGERAGVRSYLVSEAEDLLYWANRIVAHDLK